MEMSLNTSDSNNTLTYFCSKHEDYFLISFGVFLVKSILVLPLCCLILCLGVHQWRQQRSFKTASHSDIIVYNLSALEPLTGLGIGLYLCGKHVKSLRLVTFATSLFSLTFFGEMLFQNLTCVERYLAVVHPVTYLSLRSASGARLRNVSIGCIWLVCFGIIGLHFELTSGFILIALEGILVVSIVLMTFCSVSVLWTLVRPRPGGQKERPDQSKLRAFHTITAILTLLLLWFVGLIIGPSLISSTLLGEHQVCLLSASINWLNIPSSLVEPVLYLNRAGKLTCSFYSKK